MAIAGSAGGELEGPDADASAGLTALGRDLTDLAAACKVIETERCEDYTMDEGEPCSCIADPRRHAGRRSELGPARARRVTVRLAGRVVPGRQDRQGLDRVLRGALHYNPGAFGIFEDATWLPSTVEPLLGVGTQLVLKFTKSRIDRDMGLNEIESEDYAGTVICARHETGAYCTDALLSGFSYVREIDFDGQDEEISGGAIEHDLTPLTGFESTFEYRDGKLIVTRTKTMNDFNPDGVSLGGISRVLAAGEYPLAKLLGLPE